MSREESSFVCLLFCSVAALAFGSALYASCDDTVATAFGVNSTSYPSSFLCEHALVYSHDCSRTHRRLHSSHGSHGGGHGTTSHHNAGGGTSGSVTHTTYASTSSRHTIVAGSVFTLYMFDDWSHVASVRFDTDFDFCTEIFDIKNNTVTFDGPFVVQCDHDKISFGHVFGIGVACVFVLACMFCAFSCCVEFCQYQMTSSSTAATKQTTDLV